MRRSIPCWLSVLFVIGALVLGGGRLVAAQDDAAAYAGHPLIGTWTLVTDDQELPDVIIFSDDGGVIDVESSGSVQLGTWEPTGDTTANLTIISYSDEEGGFRIHASFEVAPDGQTFTASYTFELFDPATGESMGEYGPGAATGTREVATGPGTPEGSFEDLFGQFAGTPEASPAP
jgi:hypothetical protein